MTKQWENMDIQSLLSVIVIYFSLQQINFPIYAKFSSAAVQCNRKCTTKKIEFFTNCRKEGYVINKMVFKRLQAGTRVMWKQMQVSRSVLMGTPRMRSDMSEASVPKPALQIWMFWGVYSWLWTMSIHV